MYCMSKVNCTENVNYLVVLGKKLNLPQKILKTFSLYKLIIKVYTGFQTKDETLKALFTKNERG